nr:MAG TPA: hypothetical protein [Caudoviricetes sp.]
MSTELSSSLIFSFSEAIIFASFKISLLSFLDLPLKTSTVVQIISSKSGDSTAAELSTAFFIISLSTFKIFANPIISGKSNLVKHYINLSS